MLGWEWRTRDTDCLESSVHFFLLLLFFFTNFNYRHINFTGTITTATTGPATSLTTAPAVSATVVAPAAAETTAVAPAAAGGARDVPRLKPLVSFILFYLFITLMFILGPITMAAPPPPAAAGARDALVCFIWYVLYFILLH